MRQRGAVSARREPWLERTRRALRVRSGGRCEGECGRRDIPLDPAHVFGRGNKGIGEPWASCPELMAALCRDEHNDIDNGTQPDQVALREHIRWVAFWRLCARLHFDGTTFDRGDALGAIRALVDFAAKAGITHPDWASSPDRSPRTPVSTKENP
jgi:hypothetical protein